MKLLHHPNIVRIHEVYIPAGVRIFVNLLKTHNPLLNIFSMNFIKQVIGTRSKIYIVMDYVSGGHLLDKMVRINNIPILKYYVFLDIILQF